MTTFISGHILIHSYIVIEHIVLKCKEPSIIHSLYCTNNKVDQNHFMN